MISKIKSPGQGINACLEEVKKLGNQLNVVQLNWDQLTDFVNIYWQLCSKSEKVGEYLTHLNTGASF